MHGVQAKKVVGYMVMPGILPRAKNLFASGFGYLSFLMANIYSMVRLLPPDHPYLRPSNIGKFGIRHVIAEAANNLVLRKENVDQIIIFAALLISIVLLLLQIILLIWSVIVQPAMAFSVFEINTPFTDMAFMLLDSVFGVPEIFNSCVAQAAVCPNAPAASPAFPTPFHSALHSLFNYYSIGILLIGVLIFLYFVVVVVAETAVSGSPFGQRFASVWTPVRLVVAIGLLIPFNFGLNSGQYITLYAAKFGSNLATNGWITFNNSIAKRSSTLGGSGFGNANNPTGEKLSLIGLPKQQDASVPTQFMSIIHSCAYLYWMKSGHADNRNFQSYVDNAKAPVKPYFVKYNYATLRNQQKVQQVTNSTNYLDALNFYDDSDIIIRFGSKRDSSKSDVDKDDIIPTCGEIRIKVTDVSDKGEGPSKGGPDLILSRYFDIVKEMWFDDTRFRDFAVRIVEMNANFDGDNRDSNSAARKCSIGCGGGSQLPACPMLCLFTMPSSAWKQDMTNIYQANFNNAVSIAWLLYTSVGADFRIGSEIMNRGWAGAGMWYNRIAQLNGGFITAVLNVPTFDTYPKVMEDIRSENRKENATIKIHDQFKPNQSGARQSQIDGGSDAIENAKVLNAVFEYWNKEGANMADPEKLIKGNIFTDAINMLFGTGGLFAMRNENLHTHPLAQIVGLGKSLVESAVRNLGTSAVTAFLGGMGSALQAQGSGAATAAAGFFSSTAFIGLTAGVVLFYVLPFLPFVYFYFAVGSWIKSIFEAMVGVPLWALAHLRIDGHGLPGDSAQNGYFLIFEIFVRPILTVFGLIAAITIFTAQVRVLNIIWDMVTNNLSGFNDSPNFYNVIGPIDFKRAEIDQFFFTIIYTIVVYMLATASFKLIDKIPDNILRWMGSGVSAFSDINQDPTESLAKYAALGGVSLGQQFAGAITRAAGGTGGAIGTALRGEKGLSPEQMRIQTLEKELAAAKATNKN